MSENPGSNNEINEAGYRYDAFISYRHLDPDQKVAVGLHKMMEAFRLPKSLKKKYKDGKQLIHRVFRDQEELPLAQNLTDPITAALEKTEWLIVICSRKLQLSEWCKKEIDTFLSLRGRKYILVALVDGEPMESVPRKLWLENLRDREELTDEEMRSLYDVDLRVDNPSKLDKKIKEEYYKILGPMFNIDRNELKDRCTEETTKKKVKVYLAGLAVLAAVAVYVFIMSMKIRSGYKIIAEQYKELRTNEVVLLAEQSQQYLQSDDREGAVKLAYESITAYKDLKPEECRKALSDSLNLYDLGDEYNERYLYSCNNTIEFVYGNEKFDYVLIYDDSNTLTCYNYKTREVFYVIDDIFLPKKSDAILTENGYFAYRTHSKVNIVKAQTNESVYSYDKDAKIYEAENNIFLLHDSVVDCFATDICELIPEYFSTGEVVSKVDEALYIDNVRFAYRNMGFMEVKCVNGQDGTKVGFEDYLESIMQFQDPFLIRDGMVSIDTYGRHTQDCIGSCFADGHMYLLVRDLNKRSGSLSVSTLPPDNGNTYLYKVDATDDYKRELSVKLLLPAEHILSVTGKDNKTYIVYYSDYAARISTDEIKNIYIENFTSKVIAVEKEEGTVVFTCENGDIYRLSPVLDECGIVNDTLNSRRISRNSNDSISQIIYLGDYQVVALNNNNNLYVYSKSRHDGLEEAGGAPKAEETVVYTGDDAYSYADNNGFDEIRGIDNIYVTSDKEYSVTSYKGGRKVIRNRKNAVTDEFMSKENVSVDAYFGKDKENSYYFKAGRTGIVISENGKLIGMPENFEGMDPQENCIYLKNSSGTYFKAPIYDMNKLISFGKEVNDNGK